MKPASLLLTSAAVVCFGYVGYEVDHHARLLEKRLDTALAESATWRGQVDRLERRLDQVPTLAGATAEEATKKGARQLGKEIVGAPTEMAKAVLHNGVNTSEKAYKDSVKEVSRAPGNVAKAVSRAFGS